MSQWWLAGFVVRRVGEVRRHLVAVLLAASLVLFLLWLVALPVMNMATSSMPVDHIRPGMGALVPGCPVPGALPVERDGEVSST